MQDTIVWQSENDIVVPVAVQESVAETSAPAPKIHKIVAVPKDTTTSEISDSTIPEYPGETLQGLVFENPLSAYVEETPDKGSDGKGTTGLGDHLQFRAGDLSWVYLALVVMFCLVGVKFKGNSKYMRALLSDLTDTRLRHNAFDETVRETTLLILLNLTWILNAGILLWRLVVYTVPQGPENSLGLPDKATAGIGICVAVSAIYLAVMLFAYWIVGNVFSDKRKTQLWVKGAAASTGLETFLLFPISLLALVYSAWSLELLIGAAIVIMIGKIVFLYKGFRIFFTEISSWMLFLYYLCSLEIVPLILTYLGAVAACSSLL